MERDQQTRRPLRRIAILGSCLPRQCGIATYSADLARALASVDPDLAIDAVAMSDRTDYVYPGQVSHQIHDGDRDAYAVAADYINSCSYDVLSVQHEYGIFGGDSGCYLMDLVRKAKMPIVTTLHTVLRDPSPSQKAVMDELLQLSERIVVMSKKAVSFLGEIHNIGPEKIDLIPHGIPDIQAFSADEFRAGLGIDGPMILTFGLLSPDKGVQFVIEAMPKIVKEHPGATYVVVGATHPNVRASVGEVYRESLVKLASDLGLSSNVRFVDRFVTIEELVAYLGAMDVYVTPYLNPRQITSGTLAYAVGAGKTVISTPYWYAEELLGEGRGMLVPFRDAEAIADAVLTGTCNPEAAKEMGRRAAAYGKQMLWPEVGKSYLGAFARAKRDSAAGLRSMAQEPSAAGRHALALPELRFDHLFDISDDTGILQHATFSVPNRSEGYCVDDNARALQLTTYLETQDMLPADLSLLQSRYLSFVFDAFNPETGHFRNFMSYDRTWLEDSGSEDSNGRSLWALGSAVNRSRSRGRRQLAKTLFERGAPGLYETTSLRTWAYAVLAADEYLRAYPHEYAVRQLMRTMAARLWGQYEANRSDDWPWFEQKLTYGNARLPQAFVVAGAALGNEVMLEAGLQSLAWLMKLQTGSEGVFAPIGTNGFYVRGGERSLYDQQPIEAAASLSACLCAGRATGDPVWIEEAHRAFRWFLGENTLGQALYDKSTGGCHDGLHEDRVNGNQGAESTLSFLCALAELRSASVRSPVSATVTGVREVR